MTLTYEIADDKSNFYPIKTLSDTRILCIHNGFEYYVLLSKGFFRQENDRLVIHDTDGKIFLSLQINRGE